jgi:Ca-activated chloride channel family protein
MIHWENPTILFALGILPLLAGLLLYADRKRRAEAERFADSVMIPRIMPKRPGRQRWTKAAMFFLGLACLIVAAARPRFGLTVERASQRSADLFLVLDVSRSMTAEDVPPSRLERAKADLIELLDRLARDRVGLVVFAGKPLLRVPLTTDHGFVREAVEQANPDLAPRGGTQIGEAIRTALQAMPRERNRARVMVLVSDGEDHDSDAVEAAEEAAARTVKIFTIGLGGTGQGARIPVPEASGRPAAFLKYEGQEVRSRMNEALLKQIAATTGGAYLRAGTDARALRRFYQDHLAGLARAEFREVGRPRYREQFQWFLGLGLVLLLADLMLPYSPRARRQSAVNVTQS